MKTITRYIAEESNNYSSDSVEYKISTLGTDGLSDSQLLSVFINSRSKEKTSLEIAQEVIAKVGSLDNLVHLEASEFTKHTGLGIPAFIKFKAAIALDRRRLFIECGKVDALTSPNLVREFLARELAGYQDEVFAIVMLDNRHRVLELRSINVGTIDSAAVYPRTVVKHCLDTNAAAVILCHQHPSGVAEPSDTDVRLTRKLTDALALIDARVLDHIIIGSGTSTSLAERGLM